MFLPIRGFLDLGQRCSLGPPDQSQDHGALALGARRAGFLGVGGHGAFLPPFAAFWPLGAPFFWVVPLFEEAFSGATCAPCSATVAAFSVIVASAFVIVVNPFCA
jgi:hypothetical protein